jgi:3-oxoadipate enol-lactonase
VVDRFVAAFHGRDMRALQSAARAVLIERESLLPQLSRLRVPVVVVAGAEDPLYPVAEAQAIARNIPTARFVLAADSAHLTPLEQPALAETLVRELVPPSPRDRPGQPR